MLTPRQRDLLAFICRYQDEHQISPNYSEMAAALGLASKSGVNRIVKGLVERGFVRHTHRARDIEILRRLGEPAPEDRSRPIETAPRGGTGREAISQEIAAERQRQIEVEGYTLIEDQVHNDHGQLARAAAAYCLCAGGHSTTTASMWWPPGWSYEMFKPKSPRRDLVRAAALIIAEIERLDQPS